MCVVVGGILFVTNYSVNNSFTDAFRMKNTKRMAGSSGSARGLPSVLLYSLWFVLAASIALLLRLGLAVSRKETGQLDAQAHNLRPSQASQIVDATKPMSACTRIQDIGNGHCLPHRVIFVGGLQRSGTSALASLLAGLPGASTLHFDARNARHMEAAPWKQLVDVHTGRWMKWAYFKEVINTGGAEGKLLQTVFPYRYAVWDAKYAHISALLAHPSAISPLLTNASREALWTQWRRFWAPSAVLVDKSPENVLMAPFLQSLFGRARTSFVFVMRHPLCWSLVAAKWGCTWQPLEGSERVAGKAPALECISHLIDVWLGVHEKLSLQLRELAVAVLLPAESDTWLAMPEWLPTVSGQSLLRTASPNWAETQRAFRESSHGYVHCFLHGYAARRARINGSNCGEGGARQATLAQRLAWLRTLDVRVGHRVGALGYGMALRGVVQRCCDSTWDDWRIAGNSGRGAAVNNRDQVGTASTGVGSIAEAVGDRDADDDSASASAATLLRYERHAEGGEGIGLHTGGVALIISTPFLSAFNGMQQRAAQLAAAMGKLGYALHYVSLGPLNSTAECAMAPVAVICHAAGDTNTQYAAFVKWARSARAVPAVVLVGFTSLTLEVARALLRLHTSS